MGVFSSRFSLLPLRTKPALSTKQLSTAPALSAIHQDLHPLKALLWSWGVTTAMQLILVRSLTWEHRGRQESHNCPWEGRKRNGQISEIAGSSLLAKQFVINLCVKTDGEPWGGGSAKTLRRGIFRSTVFCYYAGKLLLLMLPMTVLVFDTLKAWPCTI